MWVSKDGRGGDWVAHSLSYTHNALLNKSIASADGTAGTRISDADGDGADAPALFDARVNNSGPLFTIPRETNAYTSLVKLNATSGVVFYDQKLPRSGHELELVHSISEDDARVTGVGNGVICPHKLVCRSYAMLFHLD
jgi:hypothetical protein